MANRGFGTNRFVQIPSVTDGTRPIAAWGTSLTPGNLLYGSYASVMSGATLTSDSYGILVNLNSFATSAAARDALVTLGIDPAGGTSFTDWINHLMGSNAATYITAPGGVWYYFPVFLKAGTSIGAKAMVNNATVGTGRCAVICMTQPSRPDLIRYGSFVRTFGEDTANSRGTLITQGSVSDGTFAQLGSAVADRELWYWEYGCGINNATINATLSHQDLAAGSSTTVNKLLLRDEIITTSTVETIGKNPVRDGSGIAVSGDFIYGRSQSSGAPDANFSMIAYGVGG